MTIPYTQIELPDVYGLAYFAISLLWLCLVMVFVGVIYVIGKVVSKLTKH